MTNEFLFSPSGLNRRSVLLSTRNPAVPLSNEQRLDPVTAGQLRLDAELRAKFPQAQPRTAPCDYYNCHGMVFAARRTWLIDTRELVQMLEIDRYLPISERRNILPGDVVIYFLSGEAVHSAMVVKNDVTGVLPFIEVVSKWASGSEFVHPVNHCPYQDAEEIKYYRVRSVHHE